MWCLNKSIPDLCPLSYFYFRISDSSSCYHSSSGDGFASAHVGPLAVPDISVEVL